MDTPRQESEAGVPLEKRVGVTLRELAHEFGNLLFPLQMVLELQAHSAPLSPDELGRILRGHIGELSVLTTRFRWIGRCLSGRTEPGYSDLRGDELISAALQACRFPNTAGHIIRTDVTAAPQTIHADRELLQQALSELLDNALRYSKSGTEIETAIRSHGDTVEFVVRDKGTGVAPELQSRLFQPFVSGTPKLDLTTGQLGCGLAIVRCVAVVHRGEAELRQSSSAGSEFVLRIPLSQSP